MPHRSRPHLRLAGLAGLAAAGLTGLTGCDAIEEALNRFQAQSGQRRLSDDDAFRHLRRDPNSAQPEDTAAVLEAFALEETRASGGAVGMDSNPRVSSLLRRTIGPRQRIQEDDFELLEDDYFGDPDALPSEKQSCSFNLDSSLLIADEFLIPHVGKIPARDQQRRGTCAAFAGIGAIEYAALNPTQGGSQGASARLPTLDLSEQYFYWASKPDCQTTNSCNCPGCGQGSWYGTGFDASARSGKLDIPLEADCKYQPSVGGHDTYHPLPSSCERGAVQVEEVEGWCGVNELIGLLHQGYAIPWGSPLTPNWLRTDGLITYKDVEAVGGEGHSGGHAYLIVGYRRLPSMPQEGGMCFIVKNSWGAGWGVNGYACQTLEWMRKVTFDGFLSYQQPVALKISVRDDLQTDRLPDDGDQEQVPNVVPDDDADGEDRLPPDPPDVDPEPEPTPEPPPTPDPNAWEDAALLGTDGTYFRGQTQIVTDLQFLRGERVTAREPTQVLALKRGATRGGATELWFKGDEVGRVFDAENRFELCTGEWNHFCSLRVRPRDGLLYIQFRDDDLRRVKPEEVAEDKGRWLDVRLGGRDYGMFLPSEFKPADLLNPKTYVRLGGREPSRFALAYRLAAPTDFRIRISGQEIGQVNLRSPTTSSLCTGDYRDRCTLVDGGRRLEVVPRNSGKPTN
jgi:hypothetical protein